MTPEEFVADLDAANRAALDRIATIATLPEASAPVDVASLLKMALRNELEATHCAAAWLASTTDVNVKLAYARQAGDEAKHYRLIRDRLEALGAEGIRSFDPMAQGHSPVLQYLLNLEGTVARLAAGPFTREALALVRNSAFIELCRAREDAATAELYEQVIQPDEQHHHELGRRLLLEMANDPEEQAAAKAACTRVLSMAEELQEIARMRMGHGCAPGC